MEFNETANSGFELKGEFNMGCQWRAICAWVWIKHDCMKSEFGLKLQFNIGHQWWGVVSQRTVQIIWGIQISKGQIIWAILYLFSHSVWWWKLIHFIFTRNLLKQTWYNLIITHLNFFLMFIEHMMGIAANSSHVNTSSNSPMTTETSGTV